MAGMQFVLQQSFKKTKFIIFHCLMNLFFFLETRTIMLDVSKIFALIEVPPFMAVQFLMVN